MLAKESILRTPDRADLTGNLISAFLFKHKKPQRWARLV